MSLVLDASVLIGYLSPEDVHHDQAVRILAEEQPPFFVHTITLAEVLVAPARVGRDHEVVQALAEIGVERAESLPLEAQVLARARARFGLRMPDTCVLALADQLGYPLVTFDFRLAMVANDAGVLLPLTPGRHTEGNLRYQGIAERRFRVRPT